MARQTKLSPEQQQDIVNSYLSLKTMSEIGIKYNLTRQGIWKILKKHHIDTSKHKIQVQCLCCLQTILKHKSIVRKRTHHFCSLLCYKAWLASLSEGPYIPNRHSQRLARSVIKKIFNLQNSHVVHHRDKNTFNNSPSNLMVFANQSDHLKYHRGLNITPLWPL